MADEPLLSAAAMAHQAGFDLELPAAAVLVFDESLVPTRRRPQRPISNHPFRRVAITNGIAVVLAAGPGAPSAAVAVEFLATFGARRIVCVGSAGDLTGDLDGIYPVTTAHSDEGTSAHYSNERAADPAVTAVLAEKTGHAPIATLTTDVPFRQTPERLDRHRRVASVVEMEIAAVFAVARSFDLAAGALVVPSDRFDGSRWDLGDRAETARELARAVEIATEALTG